MKMSSLKKIIVLCACVVASCGHVTVEARTKKGAKQAFSLSSKFLAQAKNLSEKFIGHWYPGRELDHICMYELVDVLDKLKEAFFAQHNKESFTIHITRLIGFKAIMRQKLDNKKALEEDFQKYSNEYQTFLGADITYAKFETFLDGLYENFCTLCDDLTNKKTRRSALRVGKAFTNFQGRLPKDFVERMESQSEGGSIDVREALMAIRRRLKL